MNLKKKIKRMLAFALKDELMEFVEQRYIKKVEYIEHRGDFRTLKMEYVVEQQSLNNPRQYERELRKAKEQFFEEVEKLIEVQSGPLTSPEYAYRRFIRLVLRVQKPII